MSEFTPGTPVTFKCGSPTFVVVKDLGKEKIQIVWFNNVQGAVEYFTVEKDAIETCEDFHERKKRMELKYNKLLFEIPEGVDPKTIVTLGFASAEHKERFVEHILNNKFDGTFIGEDPSKIMN